VLLPRFATALKAAGLDRVNISLDSLDPDRYRRLTRGGSLGDALEGVEAALRAGLDPVKLNVVMMDELMPELAAFVELTRDRALHVRFIEWMPVGGCGPRSPGESVHKAEVLAAIKALSAQGLGDLEPAVSPGGWGPAEYFRFAGHEGTVGFIGSVSDHFCAGCNRLRLTADGHLKNCLFTSHEVDVKAAVRARDEGAVAEMIAESLETKTFDKDLLPGQSPRGMSQVGG
jgi:cyclic pyranopterin phosphate synthase